MTEIQTRPVEKYYLPEKMTQSTTASVDDEFRQLLQQKIMMAMNLNSQMRASDDDIVPAPFHPTLFQSFGQVGSFASQPLGTKLPSAVQQSVTAYDRATAPKQNRATSTTTNYDDIIRQAAEKYRVDEKLIHAIIKMESNYNPRATSGSGAAGLMQLMPATAREVGVTDRFDVVQNIFGGTHYFSKMLHRHHGDVKLALAAYNAGPGNVKKYGGIPPFKETQHYVRKVMDYYIG